MTSEIEALKTNEFMRRRKLRLQQVREQSNDIAKKIRQRAKVEKLRQVVDLDVKNQKEYLQRQGELVKKLEDLYSKGINNVGASHRSASELNEQDEVPKVDVSKQRGREAAAILRRQKQEKLDEQKKQLDRKLQAREAANEISREKTAAVANKVTNKTVGETQDKTSGAQEEIRKDNEKCAESGENQEKPVTTDMATQCDSCVDTEWEPNVPGLSLPKDDSPKDNIESRSEKSKRLDLFALSEEMPSSLRGCIVNTEERPTTKPALTLVSEYLQNRALRLRETSAPPKKSSEDLVSIKETILRTRTSKLEGTPLNACCVLDEQLIPVPSWQAEKHCGFCSHSVSYHNSRKKHFSVTNSQIYKHFSPVRPVQRDVSPVPTFNEANFRRHRVFERNFKSNTTEKSSRSSAIDTGAKRNAVTMYNHSTRNTKDILRGDERLVVRDEPDDDDAYSQARRETSMDNKQKDHHKKMQEMRHKVAMTKQNVEKEYKDTINFLNSLPKDNGRPIRKAYMDEHRQQVQRDNRQQKLQQEYRKIEKECRKHSCTKSRNKSKSPVKIVDDEFGNRDFQYSWMPVPESDGSLAIHTIPTTVKEGKTGNTVKFSKVDSYHEYRSRHRHTPPTKDTSCRDKQGNKRVEAVLIQNSSDATDDSSNASESSSFEIPRQKSKDTKSNKERELSDAERIIIYKILDSKSDKKCKKKEKLMQNILKTLNFMDEKKKENAGDPEFTKEQHEKSSREIGSATFEQLSEGIYKTVSEKGLSYNIRSCYTANMELRPGTSAHKPWWDNITSMSVVDKPSENNIQKNYEFEKNVCHCNSKPNENQQHSKTVNENFRADNVSRRPHTVCCSCGFAGPSKSSENATTKDMHPSATTSTSSFKTATDKTKNALPGGYVKLIDDGGQESGKFYIGASGLLKNDAYEVVIQLRKKDGTTDKITVDEPTDKEQTAPEVQKVANEEVIPIPEEHEHGDAKLVSDTTKEPPPETAADKAHSPIHIENNIQDGENQSDGGNEAMNIQKHNIPTKVLVDKGVHTSLQMSYAVPSQMPKIDPVSRPATSTYTQTSLSSPNNRPMFFHMSSSTSTAYMSPPELVLPQFLRRDYHMTDEEKYDSMQVLNRHGYTSEREYSEDHSGCRCKKCIHAKKVIINRVKSPVCCKKHNKHVNKLDTPPNTARSRSSGDVCSHKEARSKHGGSTTSVKSHSHKHKNHGAAKRGTHNMGLHASSSAASSRKTKGNIEARKSTSRSDLNPVLKKYINKLLALNRESLKAIDVADQDCSSVTTPGSSIINVANNLNKNTPVESKISFEQIKNLLKQQIIKESKQNINDETTSCKRKKVSASRCIRRKMVHKVKSLNISRKLQRNQTKSHPKCLSRNIVSSSSSSRDDILRTKATESESSGRSKYKTTSQPIQTPRPMNISVTTDMITDAPFKTCNSDTKTNRDCDIYNKNYSHQKVNLPFQRDKNTYPCHRALLTTSSSDTDNFISQNIQRNIDIPITTSTQTSQNMEAEINLIKLAEDKLQNMEKIADLTEKCTKRLSNLAKVLEEVRKNKSLVYSQISTSDTASESDQKSDKHVPSDDNETPSQVVGAMFDVNKTSRTPSPLTNAKAEDTRDTNATDSTDFVPFLNDIPKPSEAKIIESTNIQKPPIPTKIMKAEVSYKPMDNSTTANRGRPPPALSRITLKNGNDYLVPHELSTVLEVDSLVSVRLTRENKSDVSDDSTKSNGTTRNEIIKNQTRNLTENGDKDPDLLRNNFEVTMQQTKVPGTESSDDSKLQPIDINQFNDIMLKPFITFREHAKKCNVVFDEASNLEDIPNDVVTDDISSLHSDGSLPDVIAELLKRNIISEPFKFDTPSNVNSTSISSESALSVLALSRIRKEKKNLKPNVSFQNKENIGESSDSLSLSSNPDLEIAFKKLGMGWASSTLKKTKERLALSSSTNTSSSSLSQFKLKSFNQDIPVLVTDSVSSILNITKRPENRRNIKDNSKHAEQQTALTNSMTVKEFLTNELAKKITFTNKSHKDESGEEFVSLIETKMPEDMKHSDLHDNNSVESGRSGNNRARTSTPVQIFKSMTYHSTSSSNLSNGLFSNADDLSSVKVTSNSNKNHSTSDKDDLTVPNFSLKMKKNVSDCSKSE